MSKEHDYSMIDHAIHEREMAEWRRKSAMAYQGLPPYRNQILDRRLQALRKAGAIVYTNAGGWKVADKPAEEIPPVDQANQPKPDASAN